MARKLDLGDVLPRMALTFTDERQMTLPDQIESRYNILIFYRGHW